MGALGPLNYWCFLIGCFGLVMFAGYFASDCAATLAILGYNLLGEKLPHPECGTGAVLFLRFLEASWLSFSAQFLVLGLAPKCGIPTPKLLLLLLYCAFLLFMAGVVVAFAVTEIEPGLKYPYIINILWAAAFSTGFAICYCFHAEKPEAAAPVEEEDEGAVEDLSALSYPPQKPSRSSFSMKKKLFEKKAKGTAMA